MEPVTMALLALSGLAFLGGSKQSSNKPSQAKIKKTDRIKALNEIRNMSMHYTHEFVSMPMLGDYLTVIAFRESNFNPRAANPEIETNPKNAARGLFGMRPRTVFKSSNGLEGMRSHPDALYSPRWSFVCAVYHVWDACFKLSKDGLVPNYAAIRRWWGWPSLVYDYDLSDSRSVSSLYKLEKAIDDCNQAYSTSIDPNFIWRPIENWNNYPGMDIMLQVYGLK